MRDNNNSAAGAAGVADSVSQFKVDIAEEMALTSLGNAEFAQGFHNQPADESKDEFYEWYLGNEETVLCSISSNLKLSATESKKKKNQVNVVLDKTTFNPDGVHQGKHRPVELEQLKRLYTCSASPQEVYDLEGALVKFAVTSTEPCERYAFCLMWVAAYIAMRGTKDCEAFVHQVEFAYLRRENRLKCRPQMALAELWKHVHQLQWEEDSSWDTAINTLFHLRRYLKKPLDVMCCGVHPSHMCPQDTNYDWDRSRSKSVCAGVIRKQSTPKEREKRGAVFARFKVTTREFDMYHGNDSESDGELDVEHCRRYRTSADALVYPTIRVGDELEDILEDGGT